MKQKKLLFFWTFRWAFLIFLLKSVNSFAYDVEVGGIYYNLKKNTAEVTYKNVFSNNYSGNVFIPETINVNGTTYSVTEIGTFTFCGSDNLISVTIPKSVNSISAPSFYGSPNLETIIVDSENRQYDSRDNCNAIIHTNSNTLIAGCKGTVIPNSVTNISAMAFEDSNIAKVIIPSGIISIGSSAFRGCRNLVEVFSQIENPFVIDTSVFNGISSDAILKVPKGSLSSYLAYAGWTTNFKDVLVSDIELFSKDNINYMIESESNRTVRVVPGNYGKVIEIPANVNYQSIDWSVIGIDDEVLKDNRELAAIIWNPKTELALEVNNPNMLLYVNSVGLAPASITNVIVNNVADRIVLMDADINNNFYCPREFIATKISYTHNYMMKTGIEEARGWETIALPFDVQKITHQSKGEIVPFANWKSGDTKKPFWLMTYGTGGWTEANSVKANTPYIISMPNHDYYKPEFRLSGNVTFSAENVKIPTSENLYTSNYNGRTFVPNYTNQSDNSIYALNVNNDFVSYGGSDVEGSIFFIGLRVVHPFEAYMTSASQARMYIAIDEDMTTGIGDITEIMANEKVVRVYNLNGQLIMEEENKSVDEIKVLLSAGVYIANGKKLIIK